MILLNNVYNNFLEQTKNNILIDKCLLIICSNNDFIDICYDIIDKIGNTNIYCVKNNDKEYCEFLNKKIIIFVDNPDKYYNVISKTINREMVLFRKYGDVYVSQINPECNVIIFSENLNISQQIKNISIIINKKNENNMLSY